MSKRSVWLKTMPNNLAETTCFTPTSATGQTSSLGLGRHLKTTSLVLRMLTTILFSMAHCLPLSNSVERSRSESDGTSKLVSSEYLARTFIADRMHKSLSITKYSMGPIPDPWIILVFISAVEETLPSHLTTWIRPVKYEMIQLIALSGLSLQVYQVVLGDRLDQKLY